MYSTIHSSRLYEQIIQQIQSLVVEGVLRPGDKLPPERELAEQFGVSRTAVREAVKALSEKGLVEILPGRGTFITNFTSAMMRDSLDLIVKLGLTNGVAHLNEVRTLLEPGIAALAAERSTPEEVQQLEQAVAAMDAAMADADAFAEADLEFHLALARASQNPLIPILLDPIVDQLREHRQRIFLVEGGPQRGQYHHRRILAAVKKRDPAAAREAMCAHLNQVLADSEAVSTITD
ncbi:MAG: FadR family transcriptional regulator [Anaerolineae bacterium]|nr:FadR family transcriptional regulator [Anaerolineae bacterium]